MEKVYRLLDWLDMAQAVDWLKDMTNTQLNGITLLQLCGAGQCSVYFDCLGRGVELVNEDEWPPFFPATGLGVAKVQRPIQFMDNSWEIELRGPVTVSGTGARIEDGHFVLSHRHDAPGPRFKPADIQALAAKMNGVPDQVSTAAENVALRQELAENASEIAILRQKRTLANAQADGERTVEFEALHKQLALMQHSLDDVEARRETLHLRCSYTHQLLENSQAENAQLRELLAESDAKLKLQIIERTSTEVREASEVSAIGLTFSRPSNSLVVAHAASCKFWRNFDPERPPLQKQVTAFMIERGVPARQAAELAIAIKPDDLPKS